MSVVLPAPVGPTMATVWPAFTSNEMSATPCPEFGNSKRDVLEANVAGDVVEFAQPGRFPRLSGIVLEPVEVLELHPRVEYLVDEVRYLVETADQQRGEAGEGDYVADPELAARDEQCADQQHHHHRNGRGQPVQRARQSPPVENRVLRRQQRAYMVAKRLGLVADAVVALQHGNVADRIGHMLENLMVVALDRLLAGAGLAHDQPADGDVEHAKHHQNHRHAEVERQRGRHQQQQRDEGRQMLAHEFEPQREQRIDGSKQRVQRVGRAALVMPGERHGDDAFEGFAKHPGPASMGDAVGAARHQNEGNDVESTEPGP